MKARSLYALLMWVGILVPTVFVLVAWRARAVGLGEGALLLLAAIVYSSLGVLILRRLPRHRIGWLFVITGYSLILSGAAGLLSDKGYVLGDALGGGLWLSWICLGGFVMLWFPSGRVLTTRWRWIESTGYAALVIGFFGYVFSGRLCDETSGLDGGTCLRFVDNPIGFSWLSNPEYGALSSVFFPALIAFLVGSALSLVFRYARSQGVERKQLKWFLFAVLVSVTWLVVSSFEGLARFIPGPISEFMYGLTTLAVPVSGAVAILKYRLYEIDRIISRTVGYVLVVGVLAVVYAVGAVWLPSRLTSGDSPIFVAGGTLAAAALFNPVRRRVLHGVDRRFYRSRYDAETVVEELSGRLRQVTDVDRLTADWVGVVAETMAPSSVGVWVRER